MRPRDLLRAYRLTPRQLHDMAACGYAWVVAGMLIQAGARGLREVADLATAASAGVRLMAEDGGTYPDESYEAWVVLRAEFGGDSWDEVPA
jgi:hypothetical protein